MGKIRRLFIGLIILLSFLGCDSDTNIVEDQFTYPLSVGNRWDYRRDYIEYMFTNSSRADTLTTVSGSDSCSISVVQNIVLRDSIATVQLIGQDYVNGDTSVGLYFYQSRDTGLFEIAYQDPGLIVLPKPGGVGFLFTEPLMSQYFRKMIGLQIADLAKSAGANELYFEDPPVFVLKYPLEVGSQWIYRLENHPWRIDKAVIGDTTVQVSAGTFDCYKIRLSYEFSATNVIIDDYIAKEGLIRREILFEGDISDMYGTALYCEWHEDYILMNYDLIE